MTERDDGAGGLDAFFDAVRQARGLPPGLTERIEADAARLQPARSPTPGWRWLGAPVAAGLVGLWLGLAPPAGWPDPATLAASGLAGVDILGGEALVIALAADGEG